MAAKRVTGKEAADGARQTVRERAPRSRKKKADVAALDAPIEPGPEPAPLVFDESESTDTPEQPAAEPKLSRSRRDGHEPYGVKRRRQFHEVYGRPHDWTVLAEKRDAHGKHTPIGFAVKHYLVLQCVYPPHVQAGAECAAPAGVIAGLGEARKYGHVMLPSRQRGRPRSLRPDFKQNFFDATLERLATPPDEDADEAEAVVPDDVIAPPEVGARHSGERDLTVSHDEMAAEIARIKQSPVAVLDVENESDDDIPDLDDLLVEP